MSFNTHLGRLHVYEKDILKDTDAGSLKILKEKSKVMFHDDVDFPT